MSTPIEDTKIIVQCVDGTKIFKTFRIIDSPDEITTFSPLNDLHLTISKKEFCGEQSCRRYWLTPDISTEDKTAMIADGWSLLS